MSRILKAAALARRAHEGQVRKYIDEPYIMHPLRVAAHVMSLPGVDDDIIAAALLHDVMEDCEVRYHDEISADFGNYIYGMVQDLTNPSKGSKLSRHLRKLQDREHIASCPIWVQLIKLCDRLDNLSQVTAGPRDFQLLYAKESSMLVDVIDGSAVRGAKGEIIRVRNRLCQRLRASAENVDREARRPDFAELEIVTLLKLVYAVLDFDYLPPEFQQAVEKVTSVDIEEWEPKRKVVMDIVNRFLL